MFAVLTGLTEIRISHIEEQLCTMKNQPHKMMDARSAKKIEILLVIHESNTLLKIKMCTKNNPHAPLQVFGIQVGLSQLHSDAADLPLFNIIPPFSAAGSSRTCILPASW